MRSVFKITLFTLFFIILVGYNVCLTQETYDEGELVTLYVGEIKTIAVNELTRIAISNPSVADVTSTKINEIIILAKGAGSTNLLWWDSLGQHSLQLQVFAENMGLVKQRIDSILKEMDLPDVYTKRADSEGKVLILGKLKKVEDLEQIVKALGPLQDKSTVLVKVEEETASVEIEMQVLELKKDATETLGFTPPTGTSLTEPMTKYGSRITDIPEALFHLTDWTRTALSAQLNFLIQEGKARLLSRPRLVCQSGMEAEFLVGGEKPILTTQSVSGGGESTQVEYKEYGIKLKISPRVIPGNRIQVSLNVEVSEVGDAEVIGPANAPSAKAYPLTTRSTSTQLILSNGQTLAISGLIKEKTEEELKKFPFLGDIPFIGMLFRGKQRKVGGGRGELADSELVITLTPTILSETEAFAGLGAPEEGKPKQVTKAKVVYPGLEKPGIDSYTLKVIQRIRDNFIYPPEAYKNQLQGLVNLSVHLTATGELLEVKVNKSSGWSILDENAVTIIKRIAPFPPFPPEIEDRELWINIPIAYNLE